MKETIRGWVVLVGTAPKHRPYPSYGPNLTTGGHFSATRVNGAYLFPTRREARAFMRDDVDPADVGDCCVCRATVTLTVERPSPTPTPERTTP